MFETAIENLKKDNLYRYLTTIESDEGPVVTVNGRELINFSSNNYLGLANHPKLKEAAIKAVEQYGTGSGASRLITGSMSLHQELEEKLARFKGTEAALVFNSGYHANLGVIPAITNSDSYIFSDELNHASLIDGCRLSKGTTQVYRHNDLGHLEQLLNRHLPFGEPHKEGHFMRVGVRGSIHRFIITDSIFSMDGDLAPLPDLLKLAEKYNATLYIDEAHATGVYGKNGRGALEHFGINSNHPRIIQMGTLGKALGSFGAYVCGSKDLINWLINKSRTFIFTTALPPAVLSASIAAIDLIATDQSLKDRLWENIKYFSAQSPIVPKIIGDAKATMEIAKTLFDNGIWAHPIRPPTVPEGTSRIRFTLMATHTKEQLERCLNTLNKVIP